MKPSTYFLFIDLTVRYWIIVVSLERSLAVLLRKP